MDAGTGRERAEIAIGMNETPTRAKSRSLTRDILSEKQVRALSRRLEKILRENFGELADLYGPLNIEDSIRFGPVATRLREAREARHLDLKAAAKAVRVPQYRLGDIEECRVKDIRSSDLHAYVDFLGVRKWFARWEKANRKLARRLSL
jgi:hypothetical protein